VSGALAGLVPEVRGLLADAEHLVSGAPGADAIREAERRLTEPLVIALAGRVKAGKSTLLNALVGEEMAPTDAGECTRIVTWFREGPGYAVTIHPLDGPPRTASFSRTDGPLDIDTAGLQPEQIGHLDVRWPSRSLRDMTLIDTPGLASLSPALAERTRAFLAPEDEPGPADAVIYLMRNAHPDDVGFMEAFHDDDASRPNPVTTVAVLSRADEVGSCRPDAMASAERAADRYRSDPGIRRLCQAVVPVAGLVASSARSLRESEFAALASLATAPVEEVDASLVSADRFLGPPASGAVASAVGADDRRRLMRRFGMFGIRLSLELIRAGDATSSTRLSEELLARTGLDDLRRLLATRFAERADILKARTALLMLERILRRTDPEREHALWGRIERVRSGAHAFSELQLLADLRAQRVRFDPMATSEAERLLGGEGVSAHDRLGLPPDASAEDLLQATYAAIERWRARSQSPVVARDVAEAADAVVRSCEGVLATLQRPAGTGS
jgi:hypothetical protein